MTAATLALVTLLASPVEAQDFRLPSTCGDGCLTVTAYYDYGGTRDWSCGSQTYGGHRGTDMAPFGRFTAMDEGRDVVAAAAGEVIASHDGEFDRCTTGSCAGGGGFGNHVAVRHADGKVVYYAHLRRGSVAVSAGARVTCGQRLGQIGSSGYSTGPHLHFEPRVGGSADDPFGQVAGCSGPLTYWVAQGAYRALPAQRCEAPPPPPPARDDAAVAAVEPAEAHALPEAEHRFVVRMRNSGDTAWTDGEDYLLTFDGGERMDAPEQIRLGGARVAPGAEHAFEVVVRAPASPGEHRATFRMDRFGTARFGARADLILVVDPWPDDDADGSTADVDCDDLDPGRAPGLAERCDGVDQDCDGVADDGLDCTEPELGEAPQTPDPPGGVADPGREEEAGATPTEEPGRRASDEARTLTGGCSASAAAGSRASVGAVLALVVVAAAGRRRGRGILAA